MRRFCAESTVRLLDGSRLTPTNAIQAGEMHYHEGGSSPYHRHVGTAANPGGASHCYITFKGRGVVEVGETSQELAARHARLFSPGRTASAACPRRSPRLLRAPGVAELQDRRAQRGAVGTQMVLRPRDTGRRAGRVGSELTKRGQKIRPAEIQPSRAHEAPSSLAGKSIFKAQVEVHAVFCSWRPSSLIIASRMMNFCTFPVTVIGNASTNLM